MSSSVSTHTPHSRGLIPAGCNNALAIWRIHCIAKKGSLEASQQVALSGIPDSHGVVGDGHDLTAIGRKLDIPECIHVPVESSEQSTVSAVPNSCGVICAGGDD